MKQYFELLVAFAGVDFQFCVCVCVSARCVRHVCGCVRVSFHWLILAAEIPLPSPPSPSHRITAWPHRHTQTQTKNGRRETKENHLFFVCVVRDIKRETPLAERERGKPFAHVICGGRAQSYDTVIHRPCVFL